MQESKLIVTLKLLKKEEIEGVARLLASELLLKGSAKRDCESLLNFLLPFYPDFEDDVLLKENVLDIIFKDSNSKINRLEKTMSALLQVIEYYIVHFVIEQSFEPMRFNLELSKFYKEKGMPLRSEPFLLKVTQGLNNQSNHLEPAYYYWNNQHNEERISINQAKKENTNSEQYVELFYANFEYGILLSIESLAKVVFLQRQFTTSTERALFDLDDTIKRNTSLNNNPLIKLYFLALWMFKNYREEIFNNLLFEFNELFDEFYHKLKDKEAYFLSGIRRVCIAAMHNFYFNEHSNMLTLNNYKSDLTKGLLFGEGYIHSSTASNIVNTSLKLKENDWVKYFLENYSDKIGFQHENREAIVQFCWAQYYFAEKQYDKAEENTNVYLENISYFITTRRMKIKIYFERKEYWVLESELEAFKIYLYRQYKQKNAIKEDTFIANNSFVDALKQIYHLMYSFNATKKKNLIAKLETGKYSEQDWLLEKAKQLKG
jgi:hypothetical protein